MGVPAGASRVCQETVSKSGELAASAKVGASGRIGRRLEEETASTRSLPSWISGREAPTSTKPICTWPEAMSRMEGNLPAAGGNDKGGLFCGGGPALETSEGAPCA